MGYLRHAYLDDLRARRLDQPGNYPKSWATANDGTKLDRVTFRVPTNRIRSLGPEQSARAGSYVLYWMTSFRRPCDNHALDRAVQWARELDCSLVIFEALRCDYPWASARLHQFVLDGMHDNAAYFKEHGDSIEGSARVHYINYVEPRPNASKGLLHALCKEACVLVGDDFPCFFLPRMQAAVARDIGLKFEVVDSNGLYPMRATDRVFSRAHSFRRHLHKELLPYLDEAPKRSALSGARLAPLTETARQHLLEVGKRWSLVAFSAENTNLNELPIDQTVAPAETRGGFVAAVQRAKAFVAQELEDYDEDRNHPDRAGSSRLSP